MEKKTADLEREQGKEHSQEKVEGLEETKTAVKKRSTKKKMQKETVTEVKNENTIDKVVIEEAKEKPLKKKRSSKATASSEGKEEISTESTTNTKNKKSARGKTMDNGEELEKKPTRKASTKKKSPLSEYDIHLFHEGKHFEAYKFMGAQYKKEGRRNGVRFTTWAPKAESIRVVGGFNNWIGEEGHAMERLTEQGLWSVFIPGIKEGELYKYAVTSNFGNTILKGDPYGFATEKRPNNASIVIKEKEYPWGDESWLKERKEKNLYKSPVNIYEVHLGSWRRNPQGEFLTYRELGELLPQYARDMGYTHIEIMPIMEHPLDDSWGYQVTGYYSVTSRFGSSEDFKYFVDCCHKEGIGVILDWVPGHFCKDEHGLYRFDGGSTYEYEEPTKAENKGWGAANFDLGRPEVKSFLISNALYWLREFHGDGLRVDAVANMLYLDYDRKPGEWLPNKYGGRENLEAIDFFKELNSVISKEYPDILMIAEESTAYAKVTKPTDQGGLGFNLKWNMGWMNDMLEYIQLDPIYRKYNHNKVNFSMMYNYSENFILPISHDEVVHGKKSMVDKGWGDYWNKFAGLRLFMAFMYTHPGKKTLFMGNEFAQFIEWRHYEELEWKLINQFEMHKKAHNFFKKLNHIYKEERALWELDYNTEGFQWIDADNNEQSIIIFIRKSLNPEDTLIVICNFTPVVYYDYKVGVPYKGEYEELLNTDSDDFGGSGQIMGETLWSREEPRHNQPNSITIKVPPMAALILKIKHLHQELSEEKNTAQSKEE